MGRICSDCGRYYHIGSSKFNFCKECRHRTVVIMNPQPSQYVSTNVIHTPSYNSYPQPIEQPFQSYTTSPPTMTYLQSSSQTYVQSSPSFITYSDPITPPDRKSVV